MYASSMTLDTSRMAVSEGEVGIYIENMLKTWAELSKTNYLASEIVDVSRSAFNLRVKSRITSIIQSIQNLDSLKDEDKNNDKGKFPKYCTPLMDEDHYWGCFYVFPELYSDAYSPVVKIWKPEDVPELEDGVLTRSMVAACLSFLWRSPILKQFLCVKLNLCEKMISNIEVLSYYKHLFYLDLSCNILTDISVLSNLPYLQFLSVSYNRMETILDYDPPQWFLSEVHYKYNYVTNIRDLSSFWSITILDLSNNNIINITGLSQLMHLRRLDLSYNRIKRLENLSNMRLLWLDLSYNDITSFEFGPEAGLWTLSHLEYLNINVNLISSMKLFNGCTRIRELYARNNKFNSLLEIIIFMADNRRLTNCDFRANPLTRCSRYKDVILNTFPCLMQLDDEIMDPVQQRTSRMLFNPEVTTYATRRLQRLLYIEQLKKAKVSQWVPVADSTDVPLVILVGEEATGKSSLIRRLARECSNHVELARMHTTEIYPNEEHIIKVSAKKFDEMLLNGEFLTYSEINGESYGLSRKEAFVKEGKVKITCMDLVGALTYKLRGQRPYIILATRSNMALLSARQLERKTARNRAYEFPRVGSSLTENTLTAFFSETFIITEILNDIIMSLPEKKDWSEFVIGSDCSLPFEKLVEKEMEFPNDELATPPGSEINVLQPMPAPSKSVESNNWYINEDANQSRASFLFNSEMPAHAAPRSSLPPRPSKFSTGTEVTDKRSKSVTFMPGISAETAENEESRALPDEQLGAMPEQFTERAKSIFKMAHYKHLWDTDTFTMKCMMRDSYETVHRYCPGTFWDTINMEDSDKAFFKLKKIVKDIVKSQNKLKPTFDIDFVKNSSYPNVKQKLDSIIEEIKAPTYFR